MLKTLVKLTAAAGAAAGVVYLWCRFEVTERLVTYVDDLVERFFVEDDESAPQSIHEDDFLSALRDQQDATANVASGHRS